MLFPLSIIEPCLEKASVPIEVPPDWALRTFSYASSDTSAIEEDDGEQALLVASFSQALKMAGDGQTRPVLAVTAADDAKDPAVDSERAAFPSSSPRFPPPLSAARSTATSWASGNGMPRCHALSSPIARPSSSLT